MSEDDLSPLPIKGVTFKDYDTNLPDIREATLEGSQFEAPTYSGALSPPKPATPRRQKSPRDVPPDAGGRPKTSAPRRTVSEKSLKDDELPKSTNISRNPSQNSLRPTPYHLDLSELNGNDRTPEHSYQSNSQLSMRKSPNLESPDLRSNSHLSGKGSNVTSRSNSHISRKFSNGDTTPHGKKEISSRQSSLKHRMTEGFVTPESRQIVQRKGKVVENSG